MNAGYDNKVEFTSQKRLITFTCTFIFVMTIFSLKHMVCHGSHASQVTINRSPTKHLAVHKNKQVKN